MSFLFKKVAAQDADHTEWWISGTLHALKSDRAKNDKGLRDYLRKAWEGAKAHNPEMKKFEGTANYKEIERILSQDSCGKDAAEFKVGDKVKHKSEINGSVYKIIAVGRGFHGETIYKLSGHTYPYEWYKEHEIVAADSAAMDDLNDGIKTIENKARALIADAKNARSKYADILARSEIAKNNAQVKKTFEDDIARCDKLINALKAI